MGRRKPLRPYPQTRIIVRIVGGGSRTLSSFPYTWTTTLLVKVRHSDVDSSALIASASLASDHGRLLGPGEAGAKSILAPKKCADWDSTIDALGFTINSHTMRISSTYEKKKTEAIKNLLDDHWPRHRRGAKARCVLSIAGKLWNRTYVVFRVKIAEAHGAA